MSGSIWLKWMSGVVCILGVFLGRVEAVASQSTSLQASFDCSIAAAPIEILICSDVALATLDKEMGDRYVKVRNAIDGEAERLIQLKEQRAWLKSRLTTCQIPTSGKLLSDTSVMSACLIEETRKRSAILAEALNMKSPENSAEATAVLSAESSTEKTNTPENTTASNEATVPAAQTESSPAASTIPSIEPTSAPVNHTASTEAPAPAVAVPAEAASVSTEAPAVQTEAPTATPTEASAESPAQTASSSETFVLSPPLDPKMAALLAHARENFKACRLKEALEETELVLAQTHAGAPEAIAQTNEFLDFTQSVTNLINEAVELHNSGSYDSSVTKIQEAVDKCPAYSEAVETQQKIKLSASNYYENQRIAERNRQIEAENQRVAEENARQQQSSSSSDYYDDDYSDDDDDVYCDEDGCY